MSLLSINIKKNIEKELKAQKSLLKLLLNQENNYNQDFSEKKIEIEKSIAYYEKILSDK